MILWRPPLGAGVLDAVRAWRAHLWAANRPCDTCAVGSALKQRRDKAKKRSRLLWQAGLFLCQARL